MEAFRISIPITTEWGEWSFSTPIHLFTPRVNISKPLNFYVQQHQSEDSVSTCRQDKQLSGVWLKRSFIAQLDLISLYASFFITRSLTIEVKNKPQSWWLTNSERQLFTPKVFITQAFWYGVQPIIVYFNIKKIVVSASKHKAIDCGEGELFLTLFSSFKEVLIIST